MSHPRVDTERVVWNHINELNIQEIEVSTHTHADTYFVMTQKK